MPKLLRLSGADVIRILEQLGFQIVRIRGSHHILRRTVQMIDQDGQLRQETQTVNIPVHGSQTLAPGMLKRIYRDLTRYISEEELMSYFYSE
jgi:predicted RNA binding protein YcfA (HicA-like mRNA interferase family)